MRFFNSLSVFIFHPVFLLLIIGVLVSATVYSYIQFQDASSQLGKVRVELEELRNNPMASAGEIRVLVDKVGRIVALPTNETPTVATITDIDKLKDQPFFANAQNGDKILIYSQARKAYLYRPDDNKIIEVAPINIRDNQSQSSEEGTMDRVEETQTPEDEISPSPEASPSPTIGEPTPTPTV